MVAEVADLAVNLDLAPQVLHTKACLALRESTPRSTASASKQCLIHELRTAMITNRTSREMLKLARTRLLEGGRLHDLVSDRDSAVELEDKLLLLAGLGGGRHLAWVSARRSGKSCRDALHHPTEQRSPWGRRDATTDCTSTHRSLLLQIETAERASRRG